MLEIDNFKENVLTELSLRRDKEILSNQKAKFFNCEGTPFIRITNDNYKLYRRILNSLQRCLERQYEQLVYEILKREQAKAAYTRKVDGLTKIRSFLDFEFYDTRNNHKVYVILRSHPPISLREFEVYRHLTVEDGGELCIVLTNYFEQITTRVVERNIKRRAPYLTNGTITIIDLPSFLLRFYGKEAKRCFEKAVVQLNEKLDGVIGYSITEICSEKALDRLKKQLNSDWQEHNFDDFFADSNINVEKQQKLVDKFLSGKRYSLLFDGKIYSDSYITSEWFYQKYAGTIKTDKIDMTAVVAGYFKSIEQLLDVFIANKGKGMVFEIRKISETESEEIKIGDTNYKRMLGNMKNFLQNHPELFEEQDNLLQNYYFSKLADWRKKIRNGYFHKDKIQDASTLSKIRNETLCLYFLTLSMFKFDFEN